MLGVGVLCAEMRGADSCGLVSYPTVVESVLNHQLTFFSE